MPEFIPPVVENTPLHIRIDWSSCTPILHINIHWSSVAHFTANQNISLQEIWLILGSIHPGDNPGANTSRALLSFKMSSFIPSVVENTRPHILCGTFHCQPERFTPRHLVSPEEWFEVPLVFIEAPLEFIRRSPGIYCVCQVSVLPGQRMPSGARHVYRTRAGPSMALTSVVEACNNFLLALLAPPSMWLSASTDGHILSDALLGALGPTVVQYLASPASCRGGDPSRRTGS